VQSPGGVAEGACGALRAEIRRPVAMASFMCISAGKDGSRVTGNFITR